MQIQSIQKHLLCVGLILAVLTILVGCSSDKSTAPKSLPLSQRVAAAEQQFAFKFFAAVNQQHPDSNVVYSPLDMMYELGGVMLGSKGSGETQIRQVMGVDSLTETQFVDGLMSLRQEIAQSSTSIEFHQAMFHCEGYGTYDSYLAKCSLSLGAEIIRLDCTSPSADAAVRDWWNSINHDYFNDTTPNVIDTFTNSFPQSYFSFDGGWAIPFDPNSVRLDSFQTYNGSLVPCSLMTCSDQLMTHLGTGFTAVQLPYTDADFGATFILPDSGVSISTIVEEMTLNKWRTIQSNMVAQDVTIHVPRIQKIGESLRVIPAMQQTGITLLFTDIDLSDMLPLPHGMSTYWRIIGWLRLLPDSMGTMVGKPTVPKSPTAITLTCDRPFCYIVWHKPTGTLLYLVKVVDPSKQ